MFSAWLYSGTSSRASKEHTPNRFLMTVSIYCFRECCTTKKTLEGKQVLDDVRTNLNESIWIIAAPFSASGLVAQRGRRTIGSSAWLESRVHCDASHGSVRRGTGMSASATKQKCKAFALRVASFNVLAPSARICEPLTQVRQDWLLTAGSTH